MCTRRERSSMYLMWYLGRIACVSPTGRTAFFLYYLRAEANGGIASALVGSSPQTPAAHICNTLLSIFPPPDPVVLAGLLHSLLLLRSVMPPKLISCYTCQVRGEVRLGDAMTLSLLWIFRGYI